MWADVQPLTSAPPSEVHLPNAPLTRVICQVRFPPILAIRNPDRVAILQEMLRDSYPNLNVDRAQNVDLSAAQAPRASSEFIWRLASKGQPPHWRVSLGVDFVALETISYTSRAEFISRFDTVVHSLHTTFRPTDATRLGLRYIDRITGDAVRRVGELIHPTVLGILQPNDGTLRSLGAAAVHLLTEARFIAKEGHIQARWGKVPQNTTYDPIALEPLDEPSWVLDLDMFTPTSEEFIRANLKLKTQGFAERIYGVFRDIVTDEFLRFYGGHSCPQ